MPEVSVVLAVYNGEKKLLETLNSLMSQIDCDFEIIVIDDGSTDGTGSILDAMARSDSRLRIFHRLNEGLTRALVYGCQQARGEFIARQDVGDVSLPGRLEAQVSLLRDNRELAFVGCRHTLVGPGDECLSAPDSRVPQGHPYLRGRDGKTHAGPPHGSVMFRKSTYHAVGGYRAEFYFAQDHDLWSRLIEQGDFDQVDRVLYKLRFDLAGISGRYRSEQEQLRVLIQEASDLRRQGRSDEAVLARAARIRPGGGAGPSRTAPDQQAAAAYFVGSCLASMNDPRGAKYLIAAVRHRPMNFKGWYKLAKLVLTSRRGYGKN